MQQKRAYIKQELCENCDDCLPRVSCPTGSITSEGKGEPLYVDITCIGCGKCTRLCVKRAITLL